MSTLTSSAATMFTTGSRARLRPRRAPVVAVRAGAAVVVASAGDAPSPVQLGTAKIPANCDEEVFCSSLYQWANGLVTSGQNMPFALPQRVDRLPTGFSMAFLVSDPKGEPGTFVSCGEIVASVEDVDGGGRALMVTGTGDVAMKGKLIDVPMVMQTMPGAIKNAILGSTRGL